MARRGYAPGLPSPSTLATPEILGSPFQLRKLLHRHSDPQCTDSDLDEVVDMGEHAAWANLDEPIYAEKDFEIYRPPQQQSTLPVYYAKGWLPYSADTLFNATMDVRYRNDWDKLIKQMYVVDRVDESGSEIVYSAIHLPWPFADRDYVYQRRTKFIPKQNAFVVISQTIQHANAPEERKGVVRVETFTMRLSIRSTGTSSCDFYVEYEDDSNFSIPNYVVNWLLTSQVPSFMNELRRACANYATYMKTLDSIAVMSTPAVMARCCAEDRGQCVDRSVANSSDSISFRQNSSIQARSSLPYSRLHQQLSSSDTSEGVTRRSIQRRSEGNSEGDAASSPNRSRRARKFFQRSRDKEKDPLRRRDSLKKSKSMNKLFGSGKHSSSRPPSSPPAVEEFVVEFRKQKIGLHLETDIYSNRILVAHCEKNSEAASCAIRPIIPGMVVTSVNRLIVTDSPASEVLETIKTSSRPLTLGFAVKMAAETVLRNTKELRNVLRCVFARDTCDLLKLFRPLDDDANVGAVLSAEYEGKRASKKHAHSPRSRGLAARRSPNAIDGRDKVMVPEAAVLYEIDHCLVVSLPFAEIIHLLSRNAEPKLLSFKLGLAIVGDKEREIASRSALSRKLSLAFRWKSNQEHSPFPSPVSSKHGIKSTTTTDTSSILSGEGASDRDFTNFDVQSDRTLGGACLSDYSNVTITTQNIAWAWDHAHLLKTDERVFSAALLIEKIEAFMMKEHKSAVESATVKSVFNKMHEEREWIEEIKERRTLGVKALHEFNNEEEAEWIFGQTYFGVSTHWKPGADGTVWLKLDGLVEGVDIFNTIAVMREIDLFSCWVPFCNQSQLVRKTGYVDVLAYISMIFPLLKRDAIIRAVGINACYESRCILLLGGSVDESQLPKNLDVPRLKGWNADRLEMRAFRVLIEPITKTKGRTCIVCNIDPKCPVPKTLLNFAIKKIAGILLFLLRREAEKIEKAMHDSSLSSDHVGRLKLDPDGFYAWLRPLFDRWFEDQIENRLPPTMKFPRPSELDVVHQMDRSPSASLVAGSFNLHASDHPSPVIENAPPNSASRVVSQTNHRKAFGASSSTSLPRLVQAQTGVNSKRTWIDFMYDFGIWPYFLLFIFSRVTPEDSFLFVCTLKLLFTCTCTWLGVPGAYSWQTRQLKWACRELDTLRRRCVLLAAALDILNSWIVSIWANWLFCFMALSPSVSTACRERTPLEIRESENFWLMASAFTFASAVVGVQVVVNI